MNYLPALKFNLPMRREETNIQNYQYFHKLHNKPRLRFHGDRRDIFKRYRIKNYKILSRSCQPFSFKKPSRSPFLSSSWDISCPRFLLLLLLVNSNSSPPLYRSKQSDIDFRSPTSLSYFPSFPFTFLIRGRATSLFELT